MSSAVSKQDALPVIIIGAGVAGLSAAKTLKESNVPFVILEGRNRVGGRTHTVSFGSSGSENSGVVDLGAAWINGVPKNSVYTMVKEAGLKVAEMKYVDVWRLKIFDAKESKFLSWFKSLWMFVRSLFVMSKLASIDDSHANLGDRIDSLLLMAPNKKTEFRDRYLRFPVQCSLEAGCAAPVKHLHTNLLSPGYFWLHEYDDDKDFMIKGGYKPFVDKLQETIHNDEIKLNQTVTQISAASPTTVKVTTTDKTVLEGSHVIITVPIGVLQAGTIEFSPPLPIEKSQVIDRFDLGFLEKIVLAFPTTFWRTNAEQKQNIMHISDPLGRFPIFIDLTPTAGIPTLAALITGDDAEALTENREATVDEAKQTLKKMFPDQYEDPVDIVTSSWSNDPFSMCSYSSCGPRMQPGDIEKLGEPVAAGRLLFAGEATSCYLGYVEGALVSGRREAERILASLST